MNEFQEQARVRGAMSRALSGLREDPGLARRIFEGEKAGKPGRRRIPMLLAAALAAVLILGTTTALAAVNDEANALLYQIWPWASQALKPVHLTCEDQGIRMEVLSASLEGRECVVTLTLKDLTGDRLDDTVDLFDSADLLLPYDGEGTCALLDYDASSRAATFAVNMAFSRPPTEQGKVTFRVSRFLSGKRTTKVNLTDLIGSIGPAKSIPVPGELRGMTSVPEQSSDKSAAEGRDDVVRVLDPANSLEIPVADGVTLCGAGIVNGALHVQVRYADILRTDNHGFVTASGTRDSSVSHPDSLSWWAEGSANSTRSDSVEEYIFADYPQDLSRLVLTGEFVTARPAVEGDWSVTFPLSQIQAEGAR